MHNFEFILLSKMFSCWELATLITTRTIMVIFLNHFELVTSDIAFTPAATYIYIPFYEGMHPMLSSFLAISNILTSYYHMCIVRIHCHKWYISTTANRKMLVGRCYLHEYFEECDEACHYAEHILLLLWQDLVQYDSIHEAFDAPRMRRVVEVLML